MWYCLLPGTDFFSHKDTFSFHSNHNYARHLCQYLILISRHEKLPKEWQHYKPEANGASTDCSVGQVRSWGVFSCESSIKCNYFSKEVLFFKSWVPFTRGASSPFVRWCRVHFLKIDSNGRWRTNKVKMRGVYSLLDLSSGCTAP